MEGTRRYEDPGPLRSDGARDKGEVFQLADGRAALVPRDVADREQFQPTIDGGCEISKAGVVLLAGGDVWFDYSARQATYRQTSDRDFYLGTAALDAPASAAKVLTALNARPWHKIDLLAGPWVPQTPAGTQAVGGFGYPRSFGRSLLQLLLTSTNEAQRIDALSKEGFAPGTPAVLDLVFAIVDGSAAGAPDLNFGLASASHSTDADSIAQHLLVHVDGNSTTIKVQSKDGNGAHDLAATSTAVSYAAGAANRVYATLDLRVPSRVSVYLNGTQVLSSTTIDVSAAAATWYLLAHLEKTSAADTFEAHLEKAALRIMDQALAA